MKRTSRRFIFLKDMVLKGMKRTYLNRNTIEDQRKLNTNEQSRYSSGTGEFHPAEILFEEQHFDPEGKHYFKRFVGMKRTCRRFIFIKDTAQKGMKIKFKVENSRHVSSMRTLNYSIR